MSDRYKEVFKILADREYKRSRRGRSDSVGGPEKLKYSVANSFKYERSNRYSNILSYDKTSVKVRGKGYLNANIVVARNGHWWVAAQAPLPDDFRAYVSALYYGDASTHPEVPKGQGKTDHRAVIIVQLTGYKEGGRPKADRYLPQVYDDTRGDSVKLFRGYKDGPQLLLSTQSVERQYELSSDLTHAQIYPVHGGPNLTREGEMKKDLWHYYFDAWPDHGVPEGIAIQRLEALILEVGRKREELGDCEVWVHCSAGVGRTGTFIALSSLLLPPKIEVSVPESPLGPLPDTLAGDEVAATVDGIREYRGMLVQNEDQLKLIYDLAPQGNSDFRT